MCLDSLAVCKLNREGKCHLEVAEKLSGKPAVESVPEQRWEKLFFTVVVAEKENVYLCTPYGKR